MIKKKVNFVYNKKVNFFIKYRANWISYKLKNVKSKNVDGITAASKHIFTSPLITAKLLLDSIDNKCFVDDRLIYLV